MARFESSDSKDSRITWMKLRNTEDQEASLGSEILPVIPMKMVCWPGDTVKLHVRDPAYSKMYNDLLVRGQRRLLAIFSRDGDQDRYVHEVGSVVFLTDLTEVSEKSGGVVKYEASHSVLGRARVKRLLNPSSVQQVDEQGNPTDYLRAEVQLIEGQSDEPISSTVTESISSDLRQLWQEIRSVSESIEEPRLRSEADIDEMFRTGTTWQLADTWQQLQRQVQVHRARMFVYAKLQEWVTLQQELGNLQSGSIRELDASMVPAHLQEELHVLQKPEMIEMDRQFWDPLLAVLAEPDADVRTRRLSEMARAELSVARARLSLRNIFKDTDDTNPMKQQQNSTTETW